MQKIKWEKGLLGYLLWFLLAALAAVTFVLSVVQILTELGVADRHIIIGLVCVFLIAVLRLFFCICEFEEERFKFKACAERAVMSLTEKRIHGICFLFWMLLAVAGRIAYVYFYGNRLAGDVTLYEMSQITENGALPVIAHNASCLYTGLLRLVFLFVGNRVVMAVCMQAVLQIILLFLIYAVVKKMFGNTASLWAVFFGAVMPGMIRNLNVISPDLLVSLAFCFVLFLSVSILTAMEQARLWQTVLSAFFIGMLAAGCTWMDMQGCVLLLAIVAGALTCHSGERKSRFIFAVILCLGFSASLAGIFLLESWQTGLTFSRTVFDYGTVYLRDIRFVMPKPLLPEDLVSLLVLCVMTGMAVIGFWKQDYEKSRVAAFLLLGMSGFQILNAVPVSLKSWFAVTWIFAACAGVQCFADQEEKRMMSVESNEAMPGKREEAVPEESDDVIKADAAENGTVKGIKYIHNPLPLPKKHERKIMDYDYSPDKEKMKFDIELSPGNDEYDI